MFEFLEENMARVPVSWIYKLSKNAIITELEKINEETSGTKVILRSRLISYVRAHPEEYMDKPADDPDYVEEIDRTKDLEELEAAFQRLRQENARSTSSPHEQNIQNRHPARSENIEIANETHSTAKVMDQMRKWNCHFDGKDLYTFLERVNELQRAYRFSDEQILQGYPELLRGDAQLWHRNYAAHITTLEALEQELRNFYLSPNELRDLDLQINNRKQGANETIRAFTNTLMTLMRRRGGFTENKQIETIYYNMRAEYRLHVARETIRRTTDIIQKVEAYLKSKNEFENENKITSNSQIRESNQGHRTVNAPARTEKLKLSTIYERARCCWRCKEQGHDRFNCKNKSKIFCSYCGKDDVFTYDCNCHAPGNAPRAGPVIQRARPGNKS